MGVGEHNFVNHTSKYQTLFSITTSDWHSADLLCNLDIYTRSQPALATRVLAQSRKVGVCPSPKAAPQNSAEGVPPKVPIFPKFPDKFKIICLIIDYVLNKPFRPSCLNLIIELVFLVDFVF